MRGADVAAVQRLLGVEADGDFGDRTAAAVVAWKESRGGSGALPRLTPAEHRRLLTDVPLRAIHVMERWAARGLREQPVGSNHVPVLEALAERLEVAREWRSMGYPWCSFAVFLAALASGGETARLGLCRQQFNALYAPAVLAEAEAAGSGLSIIPAGEAWRGDLALFDWNFAGGDPADHIGRLVEAPTRGHVRTVDGNSGSDGIVAIRVRSLGSVRAFARDS